MQDVVKVFKALSDPNRVRIMKMLAVRPLCVCEIVEVLQLANSTVSKHLAILREGGLIVDEKAGKWVNYSLNPRAQDQYCRELSLLLARWLTDDAQICRDAAKVATVSREAICGL